MYDKRKEEEEKRKEKNIEVERIDKSVENQPNGNAAGKDSVVQSERRI